MVDLQPQTMLEDDTLKVRTRGTDVDGDDIYFVTESVEESMLLFPSRVIV